MLFGTQYKFPNFSNMVCASSVAKIKFSYEQKCLYEHLPFVAEEALGVIEKFGKYFFNAKFPNFSIMVCASSVAKIKCSYEQKCLHEHIHWCSCELVYKSHIGP